MADARRVMEARHKAPWARTYEDWIALGETPEEARRQACATFEPIDLAPIGWSMFGSFLTLLVLGILHTFGIDAVTLAVRWMAS